MKVSELIGALSACDPEAEVVVSSRCQFDDDMPPPDYTEEHVVEGVEVGFIEDPRAMRFGMSFVAQKEEWKQYPAVRILGHLDKPVTT